MPLLWNLLWWKWCGTAKHLEYCMWEEGEWGSKGWRDGDNKGVEHCWYRRRTYVGVLYIWKLKNPFVAKKTIILCQNNNLHYFMLFTSSGQTANQSAFRNLSGNLYLTNSLAQLPLFIFFFNFPLPPQVDGGLGADLSPDDSDLEARLNSWNLGVSPGACLELLGYIQLSTCYGLSAATGGSELWSSWVNLNQQW